MNHQKC